jgi:hypothetical protein
MTITNEPLVPGQPVKFKVTGFPEEVALRSSIERFYALKPDASRNFFIVNAFNEQIFIGLVNESGKIEKMDIPPRNSVGKMFENKPQ